MTILVILAAVAVWTIAAFWFGSRLGGYLRAQDEHVSCRLAETALRPAQEPLPAPSLHK